MQNLPFSTTIHYDTYDENNVVIKIYPSVSRSIKILQWLHDEELGDISIGPLDNIELEKIDQRKTRFLARMTSFTIIFFNIDQILIKELGAYQPQDRSLQERWEKLRNKIFAHTSYGDPRRDPDSLQLTSLAYFSGQLVNGSSNNYTVGGGTYWKSSSDNAVRSTSAADLEECGIVNDYKEIIKYFDEWERNIVASGLL